MDRLHRWVEIECRDLKMRKLLSERNFRLYTYRMTNDQTGSDIRYEDIVFRQIFYVYKLVFLLDMGRDHKVRYSLNFS